MDYSLLSRSYDLRGIYGKDIDEDFYYRLGYAWVTVIGKKRVALGYDARLSSLSLRDAFIRGANQAGATVVDIGLCSSDMLSFATCYYDDIEAGGMITASHNPKEYNGFKCLSHTGEPYNFKKYGPAMVEVMQGMDSHVILGLSQDPGTTGFGHSSEGQEKIEKRNILEDWIDHILRFVGSGVDFSRYTIVADGGNGSAGAFMTRLAEKAGFRMIPLFLDPDGHFPNHHPNPMLEKNREDAKNALLDQKADLAFIFDGDADRIVILDETGAQVNSAVISAVIADAILTREPGANFIGNAVASHNFRDFVISKGREYIREMVGHVYIRENMMKNPTIAYAGEHSAHYFFRDNYFMDSGIVAGMVFLSVIAKSGKKVSEYIAQYIHYITLEETNFEVKDPKGSIAKLAEIYKNEKHDLFDGITVEYSDGSWWNFRPSSNEPLLRFNLEAKTQERFDELYDEIMVHIRTFGEASED